MSLVLHIIYIFFCVLIAMAFIHTFISHCMMWVDMRSRFLAGKGEGYPSMVRMVWSFLCECIFFAYAIVTMPYAYFFKEENELKHNDAIPIVCVHGYLHNRTAWWWFFRFLRSKGYRGAYRACDLYSPFISIERCADILDRYIRDVCRETGKDEVILIGHSMGGLVSSYYAENIAKDVKVRAVMTLGSPLHGTLLAALGYGDNARAMSVYSSFHENLSSCRMCSHIPYHAFASRIDNMIVPWDSACLKEVEGETKVYNDKGHLALLYSREIFEEIYRKIEDSNRKV
jgi:triacylglycerol lipase